MPKGYLANHHQLMIATRMSVTPMSAEQLATVMTWVQVWWGQPLADMDTETLDAQVMALGLVHNLIAQEARLPLFEPALAECQDGGFTLWLPTLPGLADDVHKEAVAGACRALIQTTPAKIEAVLNTAVKKVQDVAAGHGSMDSDGAIPILAAMHALKVDVYPLYADLVQLGQGANARLIATSATEADSAFGLFISENKLLTAKRLQQAGLPTPFTLAAKTPSDAKRAISVLGFPLVVKPERGNRGECVHVGIANEQALQSAIAAAIAHSGSNTALVQRELRGHCHRIQILNGEVLWANTRYPKSVVGDGKHSVIELVASANAKLAHMSARRRLKLFPLDEQAIEALAKQGLVPSAIPEMGLRVNLRSVTSVADGGAGLNITHSLHPANAALALDAVAACRLDSAGVDFFSDDPTVPWYENGGVILEVNFKAHTFNRPSDRVTSPAQWQFIRALKANAARISIHAFVGGEGAVHNAKRKQICLLAEGVKAWVLSDTGLTSPEGDTQPLGDQSVPALIYPMMQRPRVEALCVQVGLWGGQQALPLTHVNTLDGSDVLRFGPPHPTWAAVLARLADALAL